MAVIRFSFQRLGGIWQPIIPIGIKLNSSWQRIDVYVDSGATYTILKARIAERLRFDYRQGSLVNLQVGDGSLIRVYVHNLEDLLNAQKLPLQ